MDRGEHMRRITLRAQQMWRNGLLEETTALLEQLGPEHPLLGTINYAQARAYLRRTVSEEQAGAEMVTRTAQFAKRQRTWFRKESWLKQVLPGPNLSDEVKRFFWENRG
jgi:tRNA dimethylallyltransferase